MVMDDTIKVVLDYNEAKDKAEVDTGLWKLIHKSQKIKSKELPMNFDIVCEGSKMKI